MLKKLNNLMGARLCLGISKNGMALLQTSGVWRKSISVLSEQEFAGDAPPFLDKLRTTCRTLFSANNCAGKPLTIILADDLVRLFFTTPPSNATSMQDCQAAANARFQVLFGEASEAWQIKADWDAQFPFLTCAISHAVFNSIQQAAIDSDMTILSITSQFLSAWNTWCRHLPPNSWFGVVRNQCLTIGIIEQDRLLAVREIEIPLNGNNPQWINEHIQREALRFHIPAPQELKMCGNWNNYWISPRASHDSLNGASLLCSNLDMVGRVWPQRQQSPHVALAYFGLQK